jgi:hypothetical protein
MTPSPARLAVGFLTLAAWIAGVLLLVRLAPHPAVALIAGPLFTVPLVSLFEWLTHGLLYHRPLPGMARVLKIHVGGHHGSLFPPRSYFRQGKYSFMRFRDPLTPWRMADNLTDSLLTSGSQVALHFVIGIVPILLPAWLLTGNAAFFGSTVATLGFLSFLLAYVHGCIHNPQGRWVERQGWFMWLDRHHYIHHIDMRANINFLLPLCDWLFGTRKPALTAAEAAANPSFEEAKPLAWDVRGAVLAR